MADPEAQRSSPVPADSRRPANRDSWHPLGAHTDARIALGRAGGSLRTESLLEFKVAHARARDAVYQPFDGPSLASQLQSLGLGTELLSTAAHDRASYLARPDLGRRLAPESAARLRELASILGPRDLALIVSDGLSAAAVVHAAPTLAGLTAILGGAGMTIHPVFIAPFARVKLQDEVGGILGARLSLILLGERPGLSAHDSLGAYLTFAPGPGRSDADRNCVSNIRAGGLAPADAARKLARILFESKRLGLSGTALRDA